jgi:hypothetical protein
MNLLCDNVYLRVLHMLHVTCCTQQQYVPARTVTITVFKRCTAGGVHLDTTKVTAASLVHKGNAELVTGIPWSARILVTAPFARLNAASLPQYNGTAWLFTSVA